MKYKDFTTLCYIKKDNQYLMLHRTKKENDINKDKWIGIGGHFEEGESPEECMLREVKEETGLTLTDYSFRGIITFQTEVGITEYMCLYEGYEYYGELTNCDEGELCWVLIEELINKNLWEGDYIFLDLLTEHSGFFSLKLTYDHDLLIEAVLDGKSMELLDLCDEQGNLINIARERNLVHKYGSWHRTSHVWIVRNVNNQYEILLQKRSSDKDSYPDCYDISSAGHIPSGYDFLESAVRELEEELGVIANECELTKVGTRTIYKDDIFYGKLFKDRQISNIYVLEKDIDISELVLQESEVSGVIWMNIDDCINSVKNNTIKHCIFEEEINMVNDYCNKKRRTSR